MRSEYRSRIIRALGNFRNEAFASFKANPSHRCLVTQKLAVSIRSANVGACLAPPLMLAYKRLLSSLGSLHSCRS